MDSQRVLDVRQMRKTYGDIEILKGISLSLDRGQTKVLIGPSGSGKSTLLNCINYLVPPDDGEVKLNGVIVGDRNLNAMRAKMGFVFQGFNLFAHLTVLDNIRICPMKVKKVSKDEATERAYLELDRVGLKDKAAAYPAQLSGGQQQRVSIARALAMDPTVILFDEPTSALDPELTGEVIRVMKNLADDGMTMLVVSHEMGFARSAADEIIFMEHGVIVEQGPPAMLFSSPQQRRTADFLRVIAEHA
jgi:polar amino acid transport system ATP-binding protein